MKSRTDFVTNSSSSSFVVRKTDITEEQKHILLDQEASQKLAEFYNLSEYDGPETWDITETADAIVGYTWMDNFDYHAFLEILEIKIFDGNNSGSGYEGILHLKEKYPEIYKRTCGNLFEEGE